MWAGMSRRIPRAAGGKLLRKFPAPFLSTTKERKLTRGASIPVCFPASGPLPSLQLIRISPGINCATRRHRDKASAQAGGVDQRRLPEISGGGDGGSINRIEGDKLLPALRAGNLRGKGTGECPERSLWSTATRPCPISTRGYSRARTELRRRLPVSPRPRALLT